VKKSIETRIVFGMVMTFLSFRQALPGKKHLDFPVWF
jgi:hypothetical protein